jgi:hypothetical protein
MLSRKRLPTMRAAHAGPTAMRRGVQCAGKAQVQVKIEGMMCEKCVNTVTEALKVRDGCLGIPAEAMQCPLAGGIATGSTGNAGASAALCSHRHTLRRV